MNKRRKVKFFDQVSNRQPIGRHDLPSSRAERVLSPNADDAKTSEFKSFKRMLGESSHKRHRTQVPKCDNDLKTFEMSEGKNDEVTNVSDANKLFLPILKVKPIAQMSPNSARILPNFELDNGTKYKNNTSCSLSPIQKLTSDCWRSSLSPEKYSLNCGQKHEYEGIFLNKRKKLLQLVAEASSRELDEILSNKSDLILEFLQRLGTRKKSGNLDELPKPGQKISSGRYHSPASHKASADNKKIQENTEANIQHTLRRKWGTCIPEGHVEDQALPTFHAIVAGTDCHSWRSNTVHNEKGKSNSYTDDKSVFTGDTGRHQTAKYMISPHEFSIISAFPTSSIPHSNHPGTRWHLNSLFDDEGSENKSSYSTHHGVGHLLPKTDDLVSIPLDHDELQAFPAWECLDAGTRSRRWRSNLEFKEEGISENGSDTSGYNSPFKADKRASFPGDVMFHSLPASHAIQTRFQGENSRSISERGGISVLHTENGLTSDVGLDMELENIKYMFHPWENKLSKFGSLVYDDFLCTDQVKDPSVVPYITASSSCYLSCRDLLYPASSNEPCTLPLLQWSGDIERELSCHSDVGHTNEVDSLSLTLYNAASLPERTDSFLDVNVYEKRNIFSPSPRPNFELKWNSSPNNVDREHCSLSHSKFSFDTEEGGAGFSCIANRNRYDGGEDEKNLPEFPSHLPADLPSFGLKIFMDMENSFFSLLP